MAFQNTTTVFTSLSNFHESVFTALKSYITKSKPHKISYRDYKKFDSVKFDDELKYVLANEKIMSCNKFDEMFLRILNKHAPIKSKLLHAKPPPQNEPLKSQHRLRFKNEQMSP